MSLTRDTPSAAIESRRSGGCNSEVDPLELFRPSDCPPSSMPFFPKICMHMQIWKEGVLKTMLWRRINKTVIRLHNGNKGLFKRDVNGNIRGFQRRQREIHRCLTECRLTFLRWQRGICGGKRGDVSREPAGNNTTQHTHHVQEAGPQAQTLHHRANAWTRGLA